MVKPSEKEKVMKKHYVVYMDDGNVAFKLNIPAESEKKARDFVQGNGEVIAIKQGERNIENPISCWLIADALARSNFGQLEIDLITRALHDCDFIG